METANSPTSNALTVQSQDHNNSFALHNTTDCAELSRLEFPLPPEDVDQHYVPPMVMARPWVTNHIDFGYIASVLKAFLNPFL